jgi:hypothetical protein
MQDQSILFGIRNMNMALLLPFSFKSKFFQFLFFNPFLCAISPQLFIIQGYAFLDSRKGIKYMIVVNLADARVDDAVVDCGGCHHWVVRAADDVSAVPAEMRVRRCRKVEGVGACP